MLSQRLQPLLASIRFPTAVLSQRVVHRSVTPAAARLTHTSTPARSPAAPTTNAAASSSSPYPFNTDYLQHLACPICKQQNLTYQPQLNELHSNCTADIVIAYSILPSGVPNMIVDDARRVEAGAAEKKQ